MMRILFILKKREDYNSDLHYNLSLTTGLYNSVSFLEKMLASAGIENKLVIVNDNNDIDREVTAYKPTHVIIEALWVVPEKFVVLNKLHPDVKWIIRLHSEIPFIANEGMAMSWVGKYINLPNVYVACNAKKMLKEMEFYAKHKSEKADKIIYLPNFYPQEYKPRQHNTHPTEIHIGCFGAIRPLKNHLTQAIAALKFADHLGKHLYFHVNAARVEMKGEPVLRNLTELFQEVSHKGHILVNDGWLDRDNFLSVCSKMDLGMQVSFSETFNIVAADLISQGIPVIGTSEIPWMSDIYTANPCSSEEIYKALKRAYQFPSINLFLNKTALTDYTNKTRTIWLRYFDAKP